VSVLANSAAPSAVLTSSGNSTTAAASATVVSPHRLAEQRHPTADQRGHVRARRDHGAGALVADRQRLVQPVSRYTGSASSGTIPTRSGPSRRSVPGATAPSSTPRSEGLIGETSTATTTSLPPGSGTSRSSSSSRNSPPEEIVDRRLRPRVGVASGDLMRSLSSRRSQPTEQAHTSSVPRPTPAASGKASTPPPWFSGDPRDRRAATVPHSPEPGDHLLGDAIARRWRRT
jgi:hypothetical protein